MSLSRPWTFLIVVAAGACVVAALYRVPQSARAQSGASGFTNFETEPVRPLLYESTRGLLYVLNTPDDRLEILRPEGAGLARVGEVALGLRPVAMAISGNHVWVSNHLGDSVSVVDVADPGSPRVIHTLQVGDEPRDVVVGGANSDRILVSAARREGISDGAGDAAVWVFDAARPTAPPAVIALFASKPRALAAAPGSDRAFAASFHSGNRTSVVHEEIVAQEGGLPAPNPGNRSGEEPPVTGLIVHWVRDAWRDETGRDWSSALPFTVPDLDVFELDLSLDPPAAVMAVSDVGTTLFNLALRPQANELWVTNTDARNHVRFEPNLRGHAVANRISTISLWSQRPTGAPPVVEHIVLDRIAEPGRSPGPAAEIAANLSQPTDLVFSSDGSRAYVAAFQSAKVAELDGSGDVLRRFEVGFGPGGLALDEARGRLYVLNRFDSTISVVNLATGVTDAVVALHYDPTPEVVRAGRPFLYDATLTSGHGTMACATCHVFADLDGLAWDLGDPTGTVDRIPFEITHDNFILKPRDFKFHPMKGPMVTQSLRGMKGAGPMHWRGDRNSATDDPGDEVGSFMSFDGAFRSLNGQAEDLPADDMRLFAEFILTVQYPPNPIQNRDRSLTPQQRRGSDFFNGPVLVDSGVTNCVGCHTLPLGTNGRVNFEGNRSGQDFKAAHLRNLYQKSGRRDDAGEAISGFGFTHDGSIGGLVEFLHADVFDFPGANEEAQDAIRADLEAFLLAFDTGMAPAVGGSVTVGAATPPASDQALLNLLRVRALQGDCDLVARGIRGGEPRSWLLKDGMFWPDYEHDRPVSQDELLQSARNRQSETTFVCVPPGDGVRSALDRDQDGAYDGDERRAGSDPGDPGSTPRATPTPGPTPTKDPRMVERVFLPAAFTRVQP